MKLLKVHEFDLLIRVLDINVLCRKVSEADDKKLPHDRTANK